MHISSKLRYFIFENFSILSRFYLVGFWRSIRRFLCQWDFKNIYNWFLFPLNMFRVFIKKILLQIYDLFKIVNIGKWAVVYVRSLRCASEVQATARNNLFTMSSTWICMILTCCWKKISSFKASVYFCHYKCSFQNAFYQQIPRSTVPIFQILEKYLPKIIYLFFFITFFMKIRMDRYRSDIWDCDKSNFWLIRPRIFVHYMDVTDVFIRKSIRNT